MEKMICSLCRNKVFSSSPGYAHCSCGGRLVSYYETSRILAIVREEGRIYMKGIKYESLNNF